MLVVTVISTIAAPTVEGVGSSRTIESESPLEKGEESQERLDEGLVNERRRLRLRAAHTQTRMATQRAVRTCLIRPSPSRCMDGHRLTSEVLAPLTC